MLARAPRTKETLPDFCENMDPNKWDTTVWYLVTQNPKEFRGLTGCQRDPQIWGVIGINSLGTRIPRTVRHGLNHCIGCIICFVF